MDINIPFLGSLRVLECLGAVVDLTQQVVYFSTLDVTAKLKRVGGHLAIEINQFPAQQHRLRVWTQLADKGFDQERAFPELLRGRWGEGKISPNPVHERS